MVGAPTVPYVEYNDMNDFHDIYIFLAHKIFLSPYEAKITYLDKVL